LADGVSAGERWEVVRRRKRERGRLHEDGIIGDRFLIDLYLKKNGEEVGLNKGSMRWGGVRRGKAWRREGSSL